MGYDLAERRLILVRHSISEPKAGRPADQWELSDEGRQRTALLAERLSAYAPQTVVSSMEPKAFQTGQLVAAALGLPFGTADNLHEHVRRDVPWFDSREEFVARVSQFYERADELVLGDETAVACRQRFGAAVGALLETTAGQSVVVVCHGTVMSLFVGHVVGIDPFDFWQRLEMPAFAVLRLPQYDLESVSYGVH